MSCDITDPDILEKVQTIREHVLANASTIVARNDLLFTMSEITQAYPSRTSLANKMLRGLFDCAFVVLPVAIHLVEADGIEPTTSCLQSTRSPS